MKKKKYTKISLNVHVLTQVESSCCSPFSYSCVHFIKCQATSNPRWVASSHPFLHYTLLRFYIMIMYYYYIKTIHCLRFSALNIIRNPCGFSGTCQDYFKMYTYTTTSLDNHSSRSLTFSLFVGRLL